MGNINIMEPTAKEQAINIFSLLPEDAQLKLKRIKNSEVINHLWQLASNKDDDKFKKIVKKRALELNIQLVG